jgi:tRNA(Ile)-lysidine synthetase-like protein
MMQGMTEQEYAPLLVAVSGGVDSVVLLDRLVSDGKRRLIVAHVNHGIRTDSAEDERFVAQLADSYGLPFVSTRLELGPGASEDAARRARYDWLEAEQRRAGAAGIATAHHEDDVIETMIINLTRGTSWRGIASLRNSPDRFRPLLEWSKAEVVSYAIDRGLQWREDSTNDSLVYYRNRIRNLVMPKLDPLERQRLRKLYDAQVRLRTAIEIETEQLLERYCVGEQLRRYPLLMIDDVSAAELLRGWLGESLERSRMRDLLLFAKTARIGAKWSLDRTRFIVSTASGLIVLPSRD